MGRITATVLSVAVVLLIAVCAGGVSSSFAAMPWSRLTSRTIPTHIVPGGEGTIVVQAINLGNADTAGRYAFSDDLPPGLSLQEVEFFGPPPGFIEGSVRPNLGPGGGLGFFGYCSMSASSVSCSSESALPGEFCAEVFGSAQACQLQPIAPYDFLELRLRVRDEGASSGALNESEFSSSGSGGGVRVVKLKRGVVISGSPAGFDLGEFALVPEEEGGETDAHAGTHPYQVTTTFIFGSDDSTDALRSPAMPRNLHFRLPPGMVGNATVSPQCSDQAFAQVGEGGAVNACPSDTAIGVSEVTIATNPGEENRLAVPVFNLTPATGEPARFGFEVLSNPVILDTAVRSGPGEDYGVTVNIDNITEAANFISATTVFWGVPGDPSHNASRGWGCLLAGRYAKESGQECEPSHAAHPVAFLTMPTNCQAPFDPVMTAESWPTKTAPRGFSAPPVTYDLADTTGKPLSLSGCNQLAFHPTIKAEPTAQSASSPSGLDFNLNFDDEGLTNANGTAQSQLKDTTVTLPEGLTINPSAGVGLGGCTEADYARETVESPPGAGCPNDSKLGTVEITTPLLPTPVHGSLFVAQPRENPFGSLVALYIVAKNPITGILVKLAGNVTPDPVTGRLVTTFLNNPQLPFDHFNFHFREGQQAPLITPPTCGTYSISAAFSPWSEPTALLTDISPFAITKGAEGGECPTGGAPPFHPQIEAGTLNNSAGSFSPFVLHLSRGDGEQEISGFSTSLPPGLTGDLTGIPFCPETDIAVARHKSGTEEEANPSCPVASQVGHTLVGTGVGAVLAYVPGKVYLAGPYDGTSACLTGTPGCAPFSLVSVTSAKVGPFDLGTVVLRFGLNIDPYTAQVSVNPSSSEPIPTIIDGIVTHVRDIRVTIERPGNAPFTLNPTSCNKMTIASALSAHEGASATITSPFQAASCQSLKFAPKFTVSTLAKTSKARGASLHVNLTYPSAPQGTYANIAKVKVELPKALPSRLTTLQKACTAAQFEANPAGCPSPSAIGSARAVVPNIPEPLTGPVYFVSHGGEAFPSLEVVLQGYGVKVILVGSTFISKGGVTSTTFRAIPDNPVTSFALTLPEGPYSALTANGNLCTQKLTMPTEFTAQNGMTFNQNTHVAVTGCPKKKTLTRKQKLALALKACHKRHNHAKRAACERAARKRYGALRKNKKKKK
jgi:hypothetical protein